MHLVVTRPYLESLLSLAMLRQRGPLSGHTGGEDQQVVQTVLRGQQVFLEYFIIHVM